MTDKSTKLAIASRVILLLLQLLANYLLTDSKPDVFRSPPYSGPSAPVAFNNSLDRNVGPIVPGALDNSLESNEGPSASDAFNNSLDSNEGHTWIDGTLHFCFGGLRHWDAEYFLHIAEHLYSYENTLAFYPLYPMVVRVLARGLHELDTGVSMRSWCLFVAVVVNMFCFCHAANVFYRLTQRVFRDPNKSWNATLLFCFNPASIYFTAAYSEALFCWLSLHLMLECVTELNLVSTTVKLGLSLVSRSNTIPNYVFPIYFMLRRMLMKQCSRFFGAVKLVICVVTTLFSLSLFYVVPFGLFCRSDGEPPTKQHSNDVLEYGRMRNYVLAGPREPQNSPWCDEPFPYPFSYVQSQYGNEGYSRYINLKQLLIFILDMPAPLFLFYQCHIYFKNILTVWLTIPRYTFAQLLKDCLSFPFVVHAMMLTVLCFYYAPMQPSTRLMCSATPCLYWFAADHLPKTFDQVQLRSKAGVILIWFGSYYLIGTVLFCNNMQWI